MERPSRRLPLWQYVVLVVAAASSIYGGYEGYNRFIAPQRTSASALNSVLAGQGSVRATVSTTGSIVANSNSKLSFKTNGRIAEIYVRVGDSVKKGDRLAKLDTRDLELTLKSAEASLLSSLAKLEAQRAGSRSEELAAAQANYDAAVTKLNIMRSGGRAEDINSAQAQLNSAQTKLNAMLSGGRAEDITTAQAQLESEIGRAHV